MDIVTQIEASRIVGVSSRTISNWLVAGKIRPYIVWKNKQKGIRLKKIACVSLQECLMANL